MSWTGRIGSGPCLAIAYSFLGAAPFWDELLLGLPLWGASGLVTDERERLEGKRSPGRQVGAVDLQPLLHKAPVSRIERPPTALGNESGNPLRRQLHHKAALRGDHGEDLAIDLERAGAEALLAAANGHASAGAQFIRKPAVKLRGLVASGRPSALPLGVEPFTHAHQPIAFPQPRLHLPIE